MIGSVLGQNMSRNLLTCRRIFVQSDCKTLYFKPRYGHTAVYRHSYAVRICYGRVFVIIVGNSTCYGASSVRLSCMQHTVFIHRDNIRRVTAPLRFISVCIVRSYSEIQGIRVVVIKRDITVGEFYTLHRHGFCNRHSVGISVVHEFCIV